MKIAGKINRLMIVPNDWLIWDGEDEKKERYYLILGDWRSILPFFLPFVVACIYLNLAISSLIIFGESSRRLQQNNLQIKLKK